MTINNKIKRFTSNLSSFFLGIEGVKHSPAEMTTKSPAAVRYVNYEPSYGLSGYIYTGTCYYKLTDTVFMLSFNITVNIKVRKGEKNKTLIRTSISP